MTRPTDAAVVAHIYDDLPIPDLLAEAERIAVNQHKDGRFAAALILRILCHRLSIASTPPPSYPEIPDGWVLVPKKLTAENGAKAALIGEFSVKFDVPCPSCEVDDLEHCDECDATGFVTDEVAIDWTTIKAIYGAAISHFAAAPTREVEG